MARLRTLKPGFFLNEDLARVCPLGRLLFAGLWCIADRRGRLEDRPTRIKIETLPYDDCNVDDLLAVLAVAGFVTRYESDGRQYIQIDNFEKHQNPHLKEAESTIPAPGENSTSTILSARSLGSNSGNLEPGSGEWGVEPLRGARHRMPISPDEMDRLVTEFGPQLGGDSEVRELIAAALNHTAVEKAKTEYLYVRGWLRRDAARLKERVNGTSRGNTHGSGGQNRPGESADDLAALAKY